MKIYLEYEVEIGLFLLMLCCLTLMIITNQRIFGFGMVICAGIEIVLFINSCFELTKGVDE